MLKIGITGSIGSGKTTVCKIFETLGIPVYYADARGKHLQENDKSVTDQVVSQFGTEILDLNKKIDRIKLAAIVFNDPAKLTALEQIIHPAVFQDFNTWVAMQTSPYVLKEAALLFEAGSYKELDKIITVSAPLEIRLNRVVSRDGLTAKQVMARENRQWPEIKKIEMADYVISNDEKHLIMPAILELHHTFMGLN